MDYMESKTTAVLLNAVLQLLGGVAFGLGLLGGDQVGQARGVATTVGKRAGHWLLRTYPRLQEILQREFDSIKADYPEHTNWIRRLTPPTLAVAVAVHAAVGAVVLALYALFVLGFVGAIDLLNTLVDLVTRQQAALIGLLLVLSFLAARLRSTSLWPVRSIDDLAREILSPLRLQIIVLAYSYLWVSVLYRPPYDLMEILRWFLFAYLSLAIVEISIATSLLLNLALRAFTRVALLVCGIGLYVCGTMVAM